MRITRLLLIGVLWAASSAAAQVSPARVIVRKKLPDDLQSSFEERLSQFLAAQGEGHSVELGELLGRCRSGCNGGKFDQPYTDSYKRCLIERVQEMPMLNFDYSIGDLSISTTFEGMQPIGGLVDRFTAEQSVWRLKGTGRLQTSSESWMEKTQIMAYRDHGQWYFIPPQWSMQHKWEKVHYTKADYARDRHDEIEVRNNPSSPVEIVDVHAYMNRDYPNLRNMSFTLRNKTSKKIHALFVNQGLGEGPIDPKGKITENDEVYEAYNDFCEGTTKHTIFISEVNFADGSKWELEPTLDQK